MPRRRRSPSRTRRASAPARTGGTSGPANLVSLEHLRVRGCRHGHGRKRDAPRDDREPTMRTSSCAGRSVSRCCCCPTHADQVPRHAATGSSTHRRPASSRSRALAAPAFQFNRTFLPSNYPHQPDDNDNSVEPDDLSVAPGGPPPPYVNNLAQLAGGSPNGSWDLFVLDDNSIGLRVSRSTRAGRSRSRSSPRRPRTPPG